MTTVHRALVLSFVERYLSIVIALASNMVLARLLTPTEIGVYSVTLAVTSIAHVLRDFGIGNFLIQEKALTDDHIQTAFSLSLALGLTLAVIIFLAAPYVAQFYAAETMIELMRIVALNFVLLPFCSISLSLLRREMRFKALLYVNLLAAGIGAIAAIALAWSDFGSASMAIASVVSNATTGIGAWIARERPKLIWPGFREWRRVVSFGGQSAATAVVSSVAIDINDLVVGKVLGFSSVATLSRAQGLMNLFHRDAMGAIRNVALPALADAHRSNRPLDQIHTKSVLCITGVAWSFYAFTASFSHEIMYVLFGGQWGEAAELVPVFCLAGAAAAVCSLISTLLTATGRIDLVTRSEITLQLLRVAIAVGAATYFRTIEAVAYAFCSAFLLSPIYLYWTKSKAITTAWPPLITGLCKSGLIAISVIIACELTRQTLRSHDITGAYATLAVAAPAAAIVWLAVTLSIRHPLVDEKPLIHLKALAGHKQKPQGQE